MCVRAVRQPRQVQRLAERIQWSPISSLPVTAPHKSDLHAVRMADPLVGLPSSGSFPLHLGGSLSSNAKKRRRDDEEHVAIRCRPSASKLLVRADAQTHSSPSLSMLAHLGHYNTPTRGVRRSYGPKRVSSEQQIGAQLMLSRKAHIKFLTFARRNLKRENVFSSTTLQYKYVYQCLPATLELTCRHSPYMPSLPPYTSR